MRSYLPDYELRAPRDLAAALELLARAPGVWRAFAGGTDLMVLLEAGLLRHTRFLSLWHLPELKGIEVTPTHVTLGALTTYTQIQRHELLQREFSLLGAAARETGGIAIQNRGTLGGNIANASPAADTPPALLVYDAELELVSATGTRWLPYTEFHTGYKQLNLRADELLRRVRLPRATADLVTYYRKVGTRKAQAISKVCIAAGARVRNGRLTDIRIAFGSVAPTVVRCPQTEALLRGQALDAELLARARATCAQELTPIDDVRSTAEYRLHVAGNLLGDFLTGLAGRAPAG